MAYIPASLKAQLRVHFSYTCAYCHSPEFLSNAIFEFDHIVPEANGGDTVFENLCFCCPKCNSYKREALQGLDPETRTMMRLFHPHTDVWNEDFAWSEDKATLLGRTAVGRATIHRLKLNAPERVVLRRVWVEFRRFPPESDV
jgi:HNH endonuclease